MKAPIDLNLHKTRWFKDNPFHPELITKTFWESSNVTIMDEFTGGVSDNHIFHVIYNNEEIGSFKQDFAKNIIKQIKDVFLAKFPDATFNR